MKKQRSIYVILIVLMAVSLACNTNFGVNIVKGSGNVVTEERDVGGFEKVVMSGMGKVLVTQGDEESLTIETDDNLMRYIETTVRGDTLEIGLTDDVKRKVLNPSDGLTIRLTVENLHTINISGAGSFEIEELDVDRLSMELSGAGNVQIDALTANTLEVVISGAGNVDLAGKVVTQDINLKGFGRFEASDLQSQQATVRIGGAGGAKIWALESLDVTISGAGNVDYYGDPSLTTDISGAGSVSHEGDK